jgi:hypothetical protein
MEKAIVSAEVDVGEISEAKRGDWRRQVAIP